MHELQQFAGAEWVHLYSDELTPQTLQQHLHAVVKSEAMRGRCRPLEAGWAGLDWKDLAELTLNAYRCVIGPPPQYRSKVSTSGEGAAQ
jgi:hypothetical protein